MVGSEQNELTRTMTEQTQANSDYSGASTKFRILMVELEKHRHKSSLASTDAGPSPELKRFLRLSLDYKRERDFVKRWVDTYQPAVEAHFDAAEGYDKAQLFAEIGIVVALARDPTFQSDCMGPLDWPRGHLHCCADIDIGKNAALCFARTREHSTSGKRLSRTSQNSPRCTGRRTNLGRTRPGRKNPR